MNVNARYPIGTPGVAWGEAEKAQWLSRQTIKRSYVNDVQREVESLAGKYDVVQYGSIEYPSSYSLFALRSKHWDDALPCAVVTGGVHGYETSGIRGALEFASDEAERYRGRINLLVAPCVSPWAYEVINRWNARAVDPNRSFRPHSPAPESAALLDLVAPLERVLVHIDLHETTDTDESEFSPALSARDGVEHSLGGIPDGFYVVGDAEDPRLDFQSSIVDAVSRVPHIAPPNHEGKIIGEPVLAPGVIVYAFAKLGLCPGITSAPYKSTTEVYPDSSRTTPQECVAAQVTAVRTAIGFALEHGARPHT